MTPTSSVMQVKLILSALQNQSRYSCWCCTARGSCTDCTAHVLIASSIPSIGTLAIPSASLRTIISLGRVPPQKWQCCKVRLQQYPQDKLITNTKTWDSRDQVHGVFHKQWSLPLPPSRARCCCAFTITSLPRASCSPSLSCLVLLSLCFVNWGANSDYPSG